MELVSTWWRILGEPQVIQALWLTFKLASLTALILLAVATPLAWWLAKPLILSPSPSNKAFRQWINALVALPLILPPTVLGFYLLLLLSPHSFVGQTLQAFGLGSLAFSFTGLLIGSMVYSLPFAVHPIQNAFISMGKHPIETAMTFGSHPWTTFWRVVVPYCRQGFLTAFLLSFAHTIGEFGVVLMIGGNIPGKTQVLSTLIYGEVEALNYTHAHILSFSLVIVSLTFLWALLRLQSPHRQAH